MEKTIIKNDQAMQDFGSKFAEGLIPSDVVILIGDLGSGKTTFAKGLARALGVDSRVISPTYVIVRIYKTKNTTIQRLYHLDLYRLAGEDEVKGIDLKDFLNDKNGLVVVEWPEISRTLIEGKVWKVKIKILEDDAREVSIEKT